MGSAATGAWMGPSLPQLPVPLSSEAFVHHQTVKMINDEGETVDLYIPRKCSWTNKLIQARDFASVQINIGHLDESGIYNGKMTTFAMSGRVRAHGEGDSAIDIMWNKKKDSIQDY